MKAAIYLRVSTDRCRCRHGIKKHSPACALCPCKAFELEQSEQCQEPDCRRLCEARKWQFVVLREQRSGAADRPVWAKLVESIRRGEYGAVVFWSLDRVGRNRVQVCHDLTQIARFGGELASVRDSWLETLTDSHVRALVLQVVAWVAEGERERNIERTKAGLQRAADRGRYAGRRPIAPDRVALLQVSWRAGRTVRETVKSTGVPASTVRTYYARFAAALDAAEERAKKGGDLEPVRTEEKT